MNDVSILAQFSAPEPLLMDGEVKGFRLHLSNRLRLLYQIGFRPGDVITELNGVRLNDPDTIQQTLYNFIGSEQLSVSVMRGQQEETFRYNFD
jgi:type II secretory pathway component PulC